MPESNALASLRRLLEIMAVLRSPGGCPWDAEQTTQTLRPYLLEEAYEVLEAIDGGDPAAICDELGDLLLQIVFHARIFEERGEFDFADVAAAIADKLVRRHPHVFGESTTRDLHELSAQWERIKAEEKTEPASARMALDGIPSALPALVRARKMTEKAVRAGLMRNEPATSLGRIRTLLDSLEVAVRGDAPAAPESHLGNILFELTDLGRHLNIDAEEALRRANSEFYKRMSRAAEEGKK